MPSGIDHTLASFARKDREARLEAILASGLASTLKSPAHRATLGKLALHGASTNVTRESLGLLGTIFKDAKWPPLAIAQPYRMGGLADPAVIEWALARRIPLALPKGDATSFAFYLEPWCDREAAALPEDDLALVGAHKWLGAVLTASMLPLGERKGLGPILDRAARSSSTARAFAGIDAHSAQLAAFGTLDPFVPPKDSSDPAGGELWLHAIARPSVIARCPRVTSAIREITPARLLRNALHAEKLVRTATDDDARHLVELAVAPVREADTVMSYGNMQAVLVARAPDAPPATPALEAAIVALARAGAPIAKASKATKPTAVGGNVAGDAGSRHARIAELASIAASLAPAIERLHGRLAFASPAVASATTLAHDEDFPSVAHLLDHPMPWWTLDVGTEVAQQLLDASHYLFDSEATELATPAPTALPWELLITRIGEIMYRVLAPATSKSRRVEFAELLKLWLASGFPAHAKALRGADFVVPAAMVRGMDRRFNTRLVTWGPDRYFVRYFQPLAGGRAGVRVLEHTRDHVFRVPAGIQMGEHRPAEARFDEAAIRRVLELLESRGPVPFDASVSSMIAQRTGLSPAAATLVWTAGYEPWLVGEKKRAEYGLARDALDDAERELAKPRLREIYVSAMPANPAQLYEPAVLAERVADAWRAYRAESAPVTN